MDRMRQDLRFALRQLARRPLLSLVVVLVLTVGIGTSAVVFTVAEGILFRPPPGVGDSDRLVQVWSVPTGRQRGPITLSYPEFLTYRDQATTFDEMAVHQRTRVTLGTGEGRESVPAELVSRAYFSVLDVQMELGSGFPPGADRTVAAEVAPAILGYGYWSSTLDASPDVLGRILDVNDRTYTVIGVAPRGFLGAAGDDHPVTLWLPAADHPLLFPSEENLVTGDRRGFNAVARLGEGASPERAEEVAQALWQGMAEDSPDLGPAESRRIRVTPYRGPGSVRMAEAVAPVGVVGGLLAGIVLLMACANASGLLMARALGRRREMGIRLALGGGRERIVRQLLTESVLLAAVAGLAGLGLTYVSLELLERRLFTFPVDFEPSLAVLALTLGVTLLTGLTFGLLPALHATRSAVFGAMKDRVAGVDLRSSRLRRGFAVAQLAIGLPLLTAAALLAVQVVEAATGDYGFEDPGSVLAVRVDYSRAGYDSGEIDRLLTRIRERVQRLPGTSGAAFTSSAPFLGGLSSLALLGPSTSEGVEGTNARSRPIRLTAVDPGYLPTLGVPILRGRDIRRSDAVDATPVAVVDQDVAETVWPGGDPLGRTLIVGPPSSREEVALTVVGVAAPVRMWVGSDARSLSVYTSRKQMLDTTSMTLVVRGVEGTGAVAAATRAQILAEDADLVVDVHPLSQRLRQGRTELTHAAAGAALCGLVALLLACVGLYAMVATGVGERTREIGIRRALGGDRTRIVGHFVRDGVKSALLALAVGLPLSWITVAVMGASGIGVTALEMKVALALGGVAILMTGIALVSSWLPARRSAAVDPVLALRSE